MAFTAQISLHLYETAQIIHLVAWDYKVVYIFKNGLLRILKKEIRALEKPEII